MQEDYKKYQGSCHCGAVRFEIESDLKPTARCNCSICKRKGTIMHRVAEDKFQILAGEESLTLYQFNTKVAKHYFCKHCGIYVFHRPRTAPDHYGVNTGCLEGVDPLSLEPGLIDGASYSTV